MGHEVAIFPHRTTHLPIHPPDHLDSFHTSWLSSCQFLSNVMVLTIFVSENNCPSTTTIFFIYYIIHFICNEIFLNKNVIFFGFRSWGLKSIRRQRWPSWLPSFLKKISSNSDLYIYYFIIFWSFSGLRTSILLNKCLILYPMFMWTAKAVPPSFILKTTF